MTAPPSPARVAGVFALVLALGVTGFTVLEGHDAATAVYASAQTLSTIGYGDAVPATAAGRGFVVVYSMLGLGVCGHVISALSAWVYAAITRETYLAVVALFVAVLSVQAGVILQYEPAAVAHDPATALYFAYISAQTIGYGDVVVTTPAMRVFVAATTLVSVGLAGVVVAPVTDAILRLCAVPDAARASASGGGRGKVKTT